MTTQCGTTVAVDTACGPQGSFDTMCHVPAAPGRAEDDVSDHQAAPATRLRPPTWRDPRLAVGVLLVLGSVVLGTLVVRAADDTVGVYAAARTLTPGDPVTPADVAVVRVRLDEVDRRYVTPAADADAVAAGDAVALRGVGEGELLPRAAVGGADLLARRPVGVPVTVPLPAGMRAGSLVDVWVARADPEVSGGFTEPERLAGAAEVAEVARSEGALGAGGASTVQVLLEEDGLRALLDALANDAEVSLVLVPGSARQDG